MVHERLKLSRGTCRAQDFKSAGVMVEREFWCCERIYGADVESGRGSGEMETCLAGSLNRYVLDKLNFGSIMNAQMVLF